MWNRFLSGACVVMGLCALLAPVASFAERPQFLEITIPVSVLNELNSGLRPNVATTAPTITLTGPQMNGPIGSPTEPLITASPTTPPRVIDVPGGTPMEFCWTVDAAASYRYGWDITDLNDDLLWETGWIPIAPDVQVCAPVHIFYFGTHTFTLQAQDSGANRSLAPVVINIMPVTPAEPTTWGGVKALYR